MTFLARETSVESGQPVEIYHFSIGATNYRYTSAEDEIIFGGNTYYPRQITRTDPQQSTDERRQQIEITIPTTDDVALLFIGVVPGEKMSLTVTRFHRDDVEAYVLWSGKILGANYTEQGTKCTLRGVTVEAALSRPIPHFKYQGLCNNMLFDGNCKVVKASFKYTGTVQAISGNTVTVLGLSSKGVGWAVGGYISASDLDFRLVLSQDGDVLTLMLPFFADPTGLTVDVYAGCSHNRTDCEDKFNNIINYGGFPFVPRVNPFARGL